MGKQAGQEHPQSLAQPPMTSKELTPCAGGLNSVWWVTRSPSGRFPLPLSPPHDIFICLPPVPLSPLPSLFPASFFLYRPPRAYSYPVLRFCTKSVVEILSLHLQNEFQQGFSVRRSRPQQRFLDKFPEGMKFENDRFSSRQLVPHPRLSSLVLLYGAWLTDLVPSFSLSPPSTETFLP